MLQDVQFVVLKERVFFFSEKFGVFKQFYAEKSLFWPFLFEKYLQIHKIG